MNRPLRFVAAACGLLCLAAGAQAQTTLPASNVKLYGLVDMSVGRFQAPGGPRTYRAESGGMSTSYLGFNGVEDLGGGLQARFALEAFHRTDTGAQGRFNGDAFFARNAFVKSWGCHSGESFSKKFASATGGKMIGAKGKTQYMDEELPILSTVGGYWVR